ncbi:DUF6475 domain-containing protein [Halomonas sp. OfavH-34-E]|uniref:DUF6475 domain-containing protein n=1 Tax=Halomonas sp. OfavH-34-E TaxID=2954491 RepID=UPI0020977AC5|nr:DUF6475 domain-containing protein [Halomonas sp. OfavH-34-E]MCO7216856.1 DUF6475 domain-containing protein [Halomonas sp. OfavH-34-E]
MTDHEFEAFADVWSQAQEIYNRSVTSGTIELVFRALQSLELDEIQRALTLHIQSPDTGQFPPKPGDVIKFARGDSQSRTLQAWAKVERAIRSVGHYRDVCFDDPLIHAVIERMGGWPKVAMVDSEKDIVWLRQRFEAQYRAYAIHKPEEWPAFLPGVSTQQNAQIGQHSRGRLPGKDIAVIGDQRRAMQVAERGRGALANGTQVSRVTGGQLAGLIENMQANQQQGVA